jgi:Spy/CpxP family protein refolding chaperone
MRIKLSRLALATATVTLLATTAAVAQTPPPPPEAPMPPPGPMMRHHAPNPAQHAQHLRDVLQLRADQDGALKAYIEATAPKMMDPMGHRADGPKDGAKPEHLDRKPPTTPERLDHMSKMAEAMEKRIAATRAFYSALSPSQQKAFDALGLEEGGRKHGRRFEARGEPMFHGDRKPAEAPRKIG